MSPAKIKILKWISFSLTTLLALGTILLIPRLQHKIPDVPGNQFHAKVSRLEECIKCHSESSGHPLPISHAARQQCLFCHKYNK